MGRQAPKRVDAWRHAGTATLLTQAARAAIGLWLASALLSCSNTALREPTTLRGATMGTTWSTHLAATSSTSVSEADQIQLRKGIESRLERIVNQMSTWKPDSDLSRYNRAEAGTWMALEPELLAVLSQALDLARDSGGAYDPTVGPLVNVWGFGPDRERSKPPSPSEITAAHQRVGWVRITLDRGKARVLQPGGVYLDLSSIAKGYAIDRVSDYLTEQGHPDHLVEIGGDLRVRGSHAGTSGWRVALERPGSGAEEQALQSSDLPASAATIVLTLDEHGVATSGDYRHRFKDGSREYSHHIDPRSGYPVEPLIAAVSVVAATCAEADPLGTTLIVMGPTEAMRWATERGIAAMILVRDGDGFKQLMTPAFAAAFGES